MAQSLQGLEMGVSHVAVSVRAQHEPSTQRRGDATWQSAVSVRAQHEPSTQRLGEQPGWQYTMRVVTHWCWEKQALSTRLHREQTPGISVLGTLLDAAPHAFSLCQDGNLCLFAVINCEFNGLSSEYF